MYAKFKVYLDEEYTKTNKIKDTSNPDWNFKKVFTMKQLDDVVSFNHS